MSLQRTFVIGDIQGCYQGLQRLLNKVEFDPKNDKLYAVGDLVARGEDSLGTLRYLKSLGDSFSSVLGNHDLHLLATMNGIREAKKADNLQPLLEAPDKRELADWLRQFPLALRVSPEHTIVHAGLYPAWSTQQLLSLSEEVSYYLKQPNYTQLLEVMYGNSPKSWKKSLSGVARLRFIINACTRMRFVDKNAQLEFDTKTHPSQAPKGLLPWFELPNKQLAPSEKVLFGHWAALNGDTHSAHFIGLDTGYVWGQALTMLYIEEHRLIQVTA